MQSLLLTALLLAASLSDLRHRIIPDWASLGLVLAGLGVIAWISPPDLGLHALTGLVWFLVLAATSELYLRWRGIDGFGLGDAKLMAAGGVWLGPEGSVIAMALASTGAVVVMVGTALIRRRPLSGRSGIPFGPFIALSIWLVWLYGSLS